MTQNNPLELIEKLETGIPGFDFLSEGGLPKGRATLIAGTAGQKASKMEKMAFLSPSRSHPKH